MLQAEQKPYSPPRRSLSEIDRDEIVRQTLAEAEARLIEMPVNALYRQAFKLAIRVLRGMRP
jgi:hypothetical protein